MVMENNYRKMQYVDISSKEVALPLYCKKATLTQTSALVHFKGHVLNIVAVWQKV